MKIWEQINVPIDHVRLCCAFYFEFIHREERLLNFEYSQKIFFFFFFVFFSLIAFDGVIIVCLVLWSSTRKSKNDERCSNKNRMKKKYKMQTNSRNVYEILTKEKMTIQQISGLICFFSLCNISLKMMIFTKFLWNKPFFFSSSIR